MILTRERWPIYRLETFFRISFVVTLLTSQLISFFKLRVYRRKNRKDRSFQVLLGQDGIEQLRAIFAEAPDFKVQFAELFYIKQCQNVLRKFRKYCSGKVPWKIPMKKFILDLKLCSSSTCRSSQIILLNFQVKLLWLAVL